MRIKDKKVSIIYKFVLCIIGIISLIMTTGILDGNFNIKVFTMFTTLSNVFCILYFTIDIIYLLKNYKKKKVYDIWPVIKYMATISVVLTFIVALVILKMSVSFDSYLNASFLGVHYIIPIMALLDWILFDKKGRIKKTDPFIWLVFPALYFIVAELDAVFGNGFGVMANSRYPYYFMDVEQSGIFKVLTNCFVMGIGCLIMGYVLYLIDRLQKNK